MIPKIIHYCWFGRGELPELAKRCIASWEKYCPDYKIVRWDEDNFDIESIRYTKEAYACKKYAYITDYVRLKVLTEYGGIYMDTDVEVVASLNRFLDHQAFSGFEEDGWVPTGLMACEKDFPLFKELMHHYDEIPFINEDGSINGTTNTKTITWSMEKKGLVRNGQYQVIEGFAFYPKEVFCPLENATGRLAKTSETAAIHWFSKSWLPAGLRARSKVTRVFHRLFGKDCFHWLRGRNR